MSTSTGKTGRTSPPAQMPVSSPAAPAEKGDSGPRPIASNAIPCPKLVDDGELRRDLDRAGRLVRLVRRDRHDPGEPAILRFDPLPATPQPVTMKSHLPRALPREEPSSEGGVTTAHIGSWTLITLGLMTFICGGVLLGFSLLEERDHLWRIGLPLVLGGQAALILGLVLQMEGLWHSSHQTTQSIDQLDDRLDELRHATTTLSTTHIPPAATFYAHYAQGASPHLLLADLKGQLDLLAMKLAEQKR